MEINKNLQDMLNKLNQQKIVKKIVNLIPKTQQENTFELEDYKNNKNSF